MTTLLPRLVCLDAGGVLVNPNWQRVCGVLARHGIAVEPGRLEASEAAVKRELDDPEQIRSSTDGTRGARYFERVLAGAGLSMSGPAREALAELARYHAEHNLWESVPIEVPAALRRLRDGVPRLAVVSNSNGTLAPAFERLELTRYFDRLVDSQVVGVEKPDPRIFLDLLAELDVEPQAAVHVGDFFHIDVTGARAAGLDAWLLDAAGLYVGFPCARVTSLTAFVDALLL